MQNEFTPRMQSKTDDELVAIIFIDKKSYQKEAITAAKMELEKRNLNAVQLKKLKDECRKKKRRIRRQLTMEKKSSGSSGTLEGFVIEVIWGTLKFIYQTTQSQVKKWRSNSNQNNALKPPS